MEKGEEMILTYRDWMNILGQSGISIKTSRDGTKVKVIRNGQVTLEVKTDKIFELAQKMIKKKQ